MTSRKRRIGSKKWRNSGHKTKEWYISQYGTNGIRYWERTGRK